jgi:hypothetical protein
MQHNTVTVVGCLKMDNYCLKICLNILKVQSSLNKWWELKLFLKLHRHNKVDMFKEVCIYMCVCVYYYCAVHYCSPKFKCTGFTEFGVTAAKRNTKDNKRRFWIFSILFQFTRNVILISATYLATISSQYFSILRSSRKFFSFRSTIFLFPSMKSCWNLKTLGQKIR